MVTCETRVETRVQELVQVLGCLSCGVSQLLSLATAFPSLLLPEESGAVE